VPPLTPPEDFRAPIAPSVVILGNDAQVAARPATPVQLAHACLAAGYQAVIPASWGDELVAGATLSALRDRTTRPSIHCACPHVARRVLAAGSELASHLVSLVAPPVAAARYLRLHSDGDLRIAYVGRCPAASDDSIDARLTPEELLAQLADRGIDVGTQPEVFESVIPPDRRRHLSLPGGLPAPEILWSRSRIALETMKPGDFASELAELVLARPDALIDAAPLVGCACSGIMRGVETEQARMSVVALEPPRSAHPVVEDDGALSLELKLPAFARDASDVVADPGAPRAAPPNVPAAPAGTLGDAPPPPPAVPNRRPRLTPPGIAAIATGSPPPGSSAPPPRRRSPVGTPRVVAGSVPVSSDSEGRVLPRAYVARRRSPRAGIPVIVDPAAPAAAPESAPTTPPRPAPRHTVPEPRAAGPASAGVESERPVSRSVEPAAATPAAPVQPAPAPTAPTAPTSHDAEARAAAAPTAPTVEPTSVAAAPPAVTARAVTLPPSMGAAVGRGVAALRQRSWLVIACAIAGTGLLLGAAIGYAFAHRDTTAAAANGSERGVGASSEPVSPSGVRESVSAGGIAPVPNGARGATRRAPSRLPERAATGRPRQATPRAAAAPTVPAAGAQPTTNAAVPPAAATPSTVAAATADSARGAAGRDSIARAAALIAERDSIRREIEVRRARVDSVERLRRRIDSLQRAQLPPPPQR
jgi:hypothetical protein